MNNKNKRKILAISMFCIVTPTNANSFSWNSGELFIDFNSKLSLSSSWRVQDHDEGNIAYGNLGNRKVVGDPVVSLRFLTPSLTEYYGTGSFPEQGEYMPGRFAVTDPSICESAGLSVTGSNACFSAYVPDGPGSYSENSDNGNLNFDRGLFSQQFRSRHELTMRYHQIGFYGSALFFYDHYLDNAQLPHVELSPDAEQYIVKDLRLLDFYFFGDIDVDGNPVSFRVGSQTISWGESGFMPGLVRYQNARDMNQLIYSGGDYREAAIPVQTIWGSYGITPNLNIEGYYKLDWKPSVLPPSGSYFSPIDALGAGGRYLCFNGGMLSDEDKNRVCITRAEDRLPQGYGEWGVKLGWYIPELNDTEFGLHFLNYHSSLGVLGADEGIPDDTLPTSLQAQYFLQYPDNLRMAALSFNTLGPFGGAISGEISYRFDVPLTVDVQEVVGSAVGNLLNILFFDAENGGNLAALLGGEDVDTSALFELISTLLPVGNNSFDAIDRWLATLPTSDFRDNINEGNRCQTERECFAPYQLSLMSPLSGEDIPAYVERDIVNASLMNIQSFSGAWIGGSQLLLIGELGMIYIIDHPDYDELRLMTPGTIGRGEKNAIPSLRGLPCCDRDRWSDAFAWGYAVRASVDYPRLIGEFGIKPSIVWKHDVKGTSPVGSGGFREGVQLLRTGVSAAHHSGFDLSVDYTAYIGAEELNKLHDRDYVTATLNFSF